MTKTCGTCANWIPPTTKYSTQGKCLVMRKDRCFAEEKPASWCYVQAGAAQMESRRKAGLVETEEGKT